MMNSSIDNVFLQVWESAKLKLLKQIGHAAYHTYIVLIEPAEIYENNIILTVPSKYILDTINK